MTTQAWTFSIDHQNDAGFRAWGADFSAKLAAVGLVQTSDTGQINWGTVTRPGTNTDAGYEVWRMDDTLQGSAPIFFKFYFGTSNGAATQPRIRVEVGTASNGSGTLSGTGSGTILNTHSNHSATGVSVNNYMCAVDGYFAFVWGVGVSVAGLAAAGFILARTVDNDGEPTTLGALVAYNNAVASAASLAASLNYVWGVGLFGSTVMSLIPSADSTSLVGTDTQTFLCWHWTRRMLPCFAMCTVFVGAEHAVGSTFTATLVGADARTYLVIAGYTGLHHSGGTGGGHCMLWE